MARAKSHEPGLVLPVEAANGTGAVVFPQFPGVFVPGEPVALSALGLTAQEAADAVKDLGLPLVPAKAESDESVESADTDESEG